MALKDDMFKYRVNNSLSQEEAAKNAKITRQTWGNIEAGIQSPSKLTLAKIENLIGKENDK